MKNGDMMKAQSALTYSWGTPGTPQGKCPSEMREHVVSKFSGIFKKVHQSDKGILEW